MASSSANLYWQLGWAHILLWVAGAGVRGETRPHVHLYLADLHFKLADDLHARGKYKPAWRHRRIANEHAVLGPPPEPKPAAALAMGIPQPPIVTDARGKLFDPTTDNC
jgi:hypothetical protein